MKNFIYYFILLMGADCIAMDQNLTQEKIDSLTEEQKAQLKLWLTQSRNSDQSVEKPRPATASSPRLTPVKTLSPREGKSASSIEPVSPREEGAFARLGRSLSLGRSIGRKTAQSMAEEKPKSPRMKRDEIEALRAAFGDRLEAAKSQARLRENGKISEKAFGSLIKTAVELNSLNELIMWVDKKENTSYVTIPSYRALVDARIDEGGVDFSELGIEGASKRSTIGALFDKLTGKDVEKAKSYFESVLALIEAYSKKRAAAVAETFPIAPDYGELAHLLNVAVGTYRTGLEMSLCATLWAAIEKRQGATAELCETLVQILIEGHEGKLQGKPLTSLRQLVARQKTFKDAHVLGAFAMKFGGKIESDVVDKLIVLADGMDAKGKKDGTFKRLLEDWAFTTERQAVLFKFSFNQISGEQTADSGQIVQPLSSFDEIDRTKQLTHSSPNTPDATKKTQPAVAPKKEGHSLKDAIQNAKDKADEEDTWAKALRALGGEKAPAAEAKKVPGKSNPLDKRAQAKALLTKNEKTDLRRPAAEARGQIKATDEHRCPLCLAELGETVGKHTRPRCNHECSLCWICKEPLLDTDSVRINMRKECEHKIHKNCCHKIEPHLTDCNCGICGTLIQANAKFRAAFRVYEQMHRSVVEEPSVASEQSNSQIDSSDDDIEIIEAVRQQPNASHNRSFLESQEWDHSDQDSLGVTEDSAVGDFHVSNEANLTASAKSRKALPVLPMKKAKAIASVRSGDSAATAVRSGSGGSAPAVGRGRGDSAPAQVGRGRGDQAPAAVGRASGDPVPATVGRAGGRGKLIAVATASTAVRKGTKPSAANETDDSYELY